MSENKRKAPKRDTRQLRRLLTRLSHAIADGYCAATPSTDACNACWDLYDQVDVSSGDRGHPEATALMGVLQPDTRVFVAVAALASHIHQYAPLVQESP